jgi:glyoxylase-like metal-dependent hydrolase (beta-lactamase superfamily II)
MPFPQSTEINLFVDAETFLISKMVRENPQFGNLDYVFSDYKTSDGITYAAHMNFYIGGQPSVISRQHELSFNRVFSNDLFALPTGLKDQGDRVDTSEMRAVKITDGVYHVGQGNAYSLFINTNLGLVSAGAYGGLMERFAFFQDFANNFEPLSYQIINHHHSDHLGGVDEALKLGARLITVQDNIETIKAAIGSSTIGRDFLTIGAQTTIGQGRNRVEIYEVSTIHAASFLVAYVPTAKTIFIADHYGSPFANDLPVMGQGGLDMLAELQRLDLNISRITTAHNTRIFTFAEMQASAAAFKPVVCSGNRPVCH